MRSRPQSPSWLEEEEAGAEAGQLAGGHGEVEGWAVGGGQELETKEDQQVFSFHFYLVVYMFPIFSCTDHSHLIQPWCRRN